MLPADNDAGVIIDTVLAAKNNLGIGNEIVIKNPETGSELSIPIIGIYKAVSLPQESWWGTSGNIEYGQSPYSYLFCTIPTLEALLEKTCRHLPLLCMAKIGNRLTTSATPLNRWVFLPRIISCLIAQKTKLAGERLPLVQ